MDAAIEGPISEAVVPISGRQLALPPGPIFHLQRAADAAHDIGEFRAWAGYKDLGVARATGGLAHFQHVLSFADTQAAGRTGIHGHFAHVQIVIPTSGHGVFSYDGVITEATLGTVIAQHGGTIHDQFSYTYAASSEADNRATPLGIEPCRAGSPPRSFSFLELFVPQHFANVEIIPPGEVTETDQHTAWDHPYHAEGADFAIQAADDPDAGYRPLAGRLDLEMRDANTWTPSGRLVATRILRPATTPSRMAPLRLGLPGEKGGVEILFMINGSARFIRAGGDKFMLEEGDTLTCGQDTVGDPFDYSADMRLIRFFISARAQTLRERTAQEIARIEALGPRIITRREVRPEGDTRPVNFLRHG